MDDIGKHIVDAQESYNKALGQLKHGRGNLISRAEKLKNLGIKSSKTIPATMTNYDEASENYTIEPIEPLNIENLIVSE